MELPTFSSNWNKEDLKVEYDSSKFLVVNKNYDLHINSDNPCVKVTLQTQLEHNFPSLVNDDLGHKFHFCHRLDYATSGLICIAKTKEAAALVAKAMKNRTVTKVYIALVRNYLEEEMMEILSTIGEPEDPLEAQLRVCCDGGLKQRKSHTKVLLLQKGLYVGTPASKVLLLAKTGRRHQLRAHLSSVGHTIVGDYTYSNRGDTRPYRMMLHAYRLVIPTPGEEVNVTSEDPFSESVEENQWTPKITVNPLNESSIAKLIDFNTTVK